jgi:hypothetical protein
MKVTGEVPTRRDRLGVVHAPLALFEPEQMGGWKTTISPLVGSLKSRLSRSAMTRSPGFSVGIMLPVGTRYGLTT